MENKDPLIWKIAKKRANVKKDGMIYLAICIFLWLIWLINNDFNFSRDILYAWPKWPTLGLLIAFVLEYIEAFRGSDLAAEKEYEKLIQKQKES